jgi:TatD DNase family protein
MQLIDTHVHLNFEAFESDLDAVAARWREIGVVRLVHSCVELSEFPVIQRLAQRYAELYFAVGLHPLDAEQWIPDTETQIQALAVSDPKVVAIGETGLDFYKAANGDQQQAAFYGQLRVAHQLNLPVIIHCRDAAAPMLECLNQFWAQYGPVRGVMHCWSGTPAETQQFLDLGFYISFSGIVTFNNAKQIHASAQMVPLNQLLIETDCPFLAPVPKRGERRNEPANVYYVAQRLADLRGLSLSQLAAQTTENACQLFGLPQPIPTATLIEA